MKPVFGAASVSVAGEEACFPSVPEHAGGQWALLPVSPGCCLLEMLGFFVAVFAPFLHKLFRKGSWVVGDQTGEETPRKRRQNLGAGHGPRADGLGAEHLELEMQ